MPHETKSPSAAAASGGWGRRITGRAAYLSLLFVGIVAVGVGLILEIGSGTFLQIDPQVALGAGLIALAIGSGAMQQLVVAGRVRYYKFADIGGSFHVPWSELPLVLTLFGTGGFAIWSFWFFKTYGLALPPFLFGIAALGLGIGAVVCWPRRAGPMAVDEHGITGAMPRCRRIEWPAVAHASFRVRWGIPFVRLHVTTQAHHPSGTVDFPAFDFGVQPQTIIDVINRRIAAQRQR